MPRLPIDRGADAQEMAETIFGDEITITDATYTGDSRASGIYSNADTISPGVAPSDSGVILSTGNVRHFTNRNGEYNQSTNRSSDMNGPDTVEGSSDVTNLQTFDAAVLDVDFLAPIGVDTMTMQFVFASEEYPEYTDSLFQDFVGVWINGVYIPMEIGNIDPGTVNGGSNQSLFIDNTNDAYNTEMDGFTATLTLTIPLIPDAENNLRIAIADVSDSSYDSSLLIGAGSVQTSVIANSDEIVLGLNDSTTVDILANDTTSGASLTLTHINGQTFTVGVPITLPTGQTIVVNADGTITVTSDGDIETANFSYTIENDDGVSDVGFVTIESTDAPCFVQGTLIRTPHGDVPVEDLDVGDLVATYDNADQPVRWVGHRSVPAQGKLAPIRIAAGTFGDHTALLVSPQHRVLIRDSLAEVLFGHTEVLVAAKDLVNDSSVTRISGGEVTYYHLLFDQHEIVFSQGLETESFLPGPQINNIFEEETVEEICTLFPELDVQTGNGYSSVVRPALKSYEAEVLMKRGRAA
ncbi:Hint domain-containing protein [Shimia sediminis]|uniref:Hint domain-containing protein n=1 Tax=Shimia sediminis TaxID=2497945 RepID=UPI000F8DC132|nr:Hint domain-containing protein [Shimia sediminis]